MSTRILTSAEKTLDLPWSFLLKQDRNSSIQEQGAKQYHIFIEGPAIYNVVPPPAILPNIAALYALDVKQ